MKRAAVAEEKDEEARMQSIIFTVNTCLFIGTIAAIRIGN
jgi:hypothetical protein